MSNKLRNETLAQLEALGNDKLGAQHRKRGAEDGADGRSAARAGRKRFEV